MADERTEIINGIISPAVELRDAQYDLTSNYKRQLAGGSTFQVQEIKPQVEEFRAMLKSISADALKCLPDFRLRELFDALQRIYSTLARLHDYNREPDRTDIDQGRQFVQFFHDLTDPGRYGKSKEIAWDRIVESIALLNDQRLRDSVSEEVIRKTEENFDKSKELVERINGLLVSLKDKLATSNISENASVFYEQAKTHRLNASVWGVLSICLIAIDVIVIYSLYSSIKDLKPHEISIQLSVLILLLISVVSYTILISIRNFQSEKHNQLVNKHKANCLGTYDIFVKSAPNDIKDVILQYTTQTIFAPFNPGYLSKNPIQSPSPTLELFRSITTEKRPD